MSSINQTSWINRLTSWLPSLRQSAHIIGTGSMLWLIASAGIPVQAAADRKGREKKPQSDQAPVKTETQFFFFPTTPGTSPESKNLKDVLFPQKEKDSLIRTVTFPHNFYQLLDHLTINIDIYLAYLKSHAQNNGVDFNQLYYDRILVNHDPHKKWRKKYQNELNNAKQDWNRATQTVVAKTLLTKLLIDAIATAPSAWHANLFKTILPKLTFLIIHAESTVSPTEAGEVFFNPEKNGIVIKNPWLMKQDDLVRVQLPLVLMQAAIAFAKAETGNPATSKQTKSQLASIVGNKKEREIIKNSIHNSVVLTAQQDPDMTHACEYYQPMVRIYTSKKAGDHPELSTQEATIEQIGFHAKLLATDVRLSNGERISIVLDSADRRRPNGDVRVSGYVAEWARTSEAPLVMSDVYKAEARFLMTTGYNETNYRLWGDATPEESKNLAVSTYALRLMATQRVEFLQAAVPEVVARVNAILGDKLALKFGASSSSNLENIEKQFGQAMDSLSPDLRPRGP